MNIAKNIKIRNIIFLILFFSMMIVSNKIVKAESGKVLIVYKHESEMEEIKNLVLACEKEPICIKETDYNSKILEDSSLLITTSILPYNDAKIKNINTICIGSEFSKFDDIKLKKLTNTNIELLFQNYTVSSTFERELYVIDAPIENDFGQVTTKINSITPFCININNITYIPYYKKNGLSAIMLGNIIQNYLKSENTGKMYILVDEIYPFSNLGKLCSFADRMYENGIPFIVRIMPIYDNLNYPAFLKYAQVLQYLQAKNGTIVLHDPIVKENETQTEALEVKIARLKKVLKDNNIYDMDIKYPPYLLKFDEFMDIESNQKNFGQLPIDNMIQLPNIENITSIDGLIEQLNSKWITASDYKRRFTEDNFQYNEINVDKDFVYYEEQDGEFKSFFSKGNKFLIGIIGISLVIFIGLIFIGNKVYKNKFF